MLSLLCWRLMISHQKETEVRRATWWKFCTFPRISPFLRLNFFYQSMHAVNSTHHFLHLYFSITESVFCVIGLSYKIWRCMPSHYCTYGLRLRAVKTCFLSFPPLKETHLHMFKFYSGGQVFTLVTGSFHFEIILIDILTKMFPEASTWGLLFIHFLDTSRFLFLEKQ